MSYAPLLIIVYNNDTDCTGDGNKRPARFEISAQCVSSQHYTKL